MLRIGIDATPLMHQPTGVGLFVRHLINELQHHPLDLRPFAITRRAKKELRPLLPEGMIGFSSEFPARVVHRMWPRFEFPKIEGWTGPIDVAHGTNYVVGPTKAAAIATVHDLTMLRYPEWVQSASLQFPVLIRRAIDRGATLQCFTNLVADQIAEDFHLSTDRIAVIQPGIIPVPDADANSARQQLGTERYVLVIGTIEPRKNLANLLRAFDLVTERDSETTLVVVGADGWGTEEFNRTQEQMRYPERVRRIGYVENQARAELLRGAAVLAYPSWYEGFGHPPLEAMSVGVPVVASSAAPMPEVLGDAAEYAAPDDVIGLAAALRRALDDTARRDALIAAGYLQASKYSWLACGTAFEQLYRQVAEAK